MMKKSAIEMEVLLDDSIPIRSWEEFIGNNPHSTPFQSPGFYQFLNSVNDISARAFAVSDKGNIKALAVIAIQGEKGIAGHFSRRGIIFGGPLVEETCPQALDDLLVAVDLYVNADTIYLESRNLSDYSLLKDTFVRNGYKYVPYLNYKVDTSNTELMIKNISNSRLRQVRKASSKSVKCLEAQNENEVMLFYLMLRDVYKKKIKKPLPREDFFINFFRQGLGKYLIVWHEEEVIGGIMCPFLPGKTLYEFYICGRDDKYRDLYPSVMATWSALDYACHNNYRFFDFMGAGKPDEQYGVREFKSRFGGIQVEYGRFLKVRKPILYYIGTSVLQMKHKIF